jgi:hypothetical protein
MFSSSARGRRPWHTTAQRTLPSTTLLPALSDLSSYKQTPGVPRDNSTPMAL